LSISSNWKKTNFLSHKLLTLYSLWRRRWMAKKCCFCTYVCITYICMWRTRTWCRSGPGYSAPYLIFLYMFTQKSLGQVQKRSQSDNLPRPLIYEPFFYKKMVRIVFKRFPGVGSEPGSSRFHLFSHFLPLYR
jgi:hypothetical protein